MKTNERQEQWKKVEKAIDRLNDKSHLRQKVHNIDKAVEDFERFENDKDTPHKDSDRVAKSATSGEALL